MAENSSAQERTEEPTGKRIRDSRNKGQIARSRELNTTVMLLASAFAYLILGDSVAEDIRNLIAYDLTLDRADMFDKGNVLFALKVNVIAALEALAPIFALMLVAVFIGPLSMGGWVFSVKALSPKFSKLNPAAGFKRMFGIQGLVELLKALAKFVLIGGTAIWMLNSLSERYLNLGMLPLGHGVEEGMELLGYVFLVLSTTLIVVSGIDVPFQRWRHMSKLKMTKQEIKEENKETQGNPELKQRIRNVQYELSNRRMMHEVPTADVIITNPTHFSVALRYDQDTGGGTDSGGQGCGRDCSENQGNRT